MTAWFRALVCASALVLVGAPTTTAATPERVLAGDFHRGLALALDAAGRRHVVAVAGDGDLWYATDRTGTWTSQRILAAEDGAFVWSWPAIATDDDGRVHVVAVRDHVFDTPGSTSGIFYTTDRGRQRGDFRPKVLVAPAMMTTPSLRIADGIRYLAYARCLCVPEQTEAPVFFKTDRGGRWRVERIADRGFDPALRVDADGRPRIVFSDRQDLRYSAARTRKGGFPKPARIASTLGRPGTPSLALDLRGRPVVVWATWAMSPDVLFVRRSAFGWGVPRRVARGAMAELSIDARGRPHVVAGGQRIIHRWLVAGAWEREVLARGVDVMGVDIRAFGRRATIAWSQDVPPRGVWVVRD